MAIVESGQRQGRARVRRTKGDLRRRQALADAAAGIGPGEADVPAEAARVERFRCVIYLCGAPSTDITAPRRECAEYAEAFGWEVTGVIEEHAGLLPPHGRDGLGRAVEHIRSGEAGAVLTAWRSMISSVPQEYDEVAREIEKAGGFLHVKDSVHSERRVVR
ncbi:MULTISPECIES: recombinase family protein [Streptomyces]|uniref:Recombinase family protein n=1 Tax=Streptomyces sudanensis TaxID=436397 RepID=A0ABY4TES1_9ACTN|nr:MULTISPECIES: recombinase family protein [Streptomyces]MCP9958473.1 recombinase family protein [Streptomyces sudanensis]MCQ0001016.1 recombinase family protein [Streptomyces sudanensis]URN16604.1 recombinase family protein [Streptomyces sudanensis]